MTRLEVQNFSANKLAILVTCSAGTYIRSIADDLGQRLLRRLLSCLRRIRSGEYSVDQARSLGQFGALAAERRLAEALIPMARMLPEMPSEHFDFFTNAHKARTRVPHFAF